MQEIEDTGHVATKTPPSAWVEQVSAAASLAPPAAVLLIPETFDEDVAIFSTDLLHVVKMLRIDGVDAAFLDGEKGRTFVSRFSADDPGVILGILLNVFSNGVWDAAKISFKILRSRLAERRASADSDHAVFRLGITQNADGSETMWQEFSGPSDAVAAHAENVMKKYLSRIEGVSSTES